jgi:hypothetical protein
MNGPDSVFVVLQQVEASTWCVVRRRLENGKPTFASRVATARPYDATRRIAVDTARAERLRIGIQAIGKDMRRFDPQNDMREPKS